MRFSHLSPGLYPPRSLRNEEVALIDQFREEKRSDLNDISNSKRVEEKHSSFHHAYEPRTCAEIDAAPVVLDRVPLVIRRFWVGAAILALDACPRAVHGGGADQLVVRVRAERQTRVRRRIFDPRERHNTTTEPLRKTHISF